MSFRTLLLSALALCLAAPALAQTPQPVADPGAPLSGYLRKALGLPTAAVVKTATYVRNVIYGHRDGIALDAIRILGGNGHINDYSTGRLVRDAKLYEIGAGTSEIRCWLIGRELFAETV